jgi:hypothetical protein
MLAPIAPAANVRTRRVKESGSIAVRIADRKRLGLVVLAWPRPTDLVVAGSAASADYGAPELLGDAPLERGRDVGLAESGIALPILSSLDLYRRSCCWWICHLRRLRRARALRRCIPLSAAAT